MHYPPSHLSDVLNRYVSRAGYTAGQLARLSGIPKATIVNWLEGRVKRPRGSEDLLKLAAILHLEEGEATELLQSAGHPSIAEFREQARQDDGALSALLTPWKESEQSRPAHVPFQAIPDLPHFVGREQLIAELSSALLAGEQGGIYTLQGMAGVGKTALAAHLAYQLRSYFPDGVLWARVDTSDAMSILSTFARAYGRDASQYTDLSSRSRVVRELLADKRALIVLDNAQSSAEVEPLLPPSGACAVLITTRRRNLAITRGSQRFLIGPFDEQQEEALRLFGRVLGEQRVAAERQALAEIAALLGGLPLAVDIVASRLAYEPGWSAADFLRRLRTERRRLRELAYEQQSVRLSFQMSHDALALEEQHFFAALSVFAGEDFRVDAAAYVATGRTTEEAQMDAEDILRRLFGLSLVRRGRLGRYRLHPLLRSYAHTQLADEEADARMVRYFTDFVAQHQRDYAALDLDYDNILEALRVARKAAAGEDFLALTSAFYHFLEARGRYDVARELLTEAEAVAQGGDYLPQLVFIRRCQGRLAERRGQYAEAEAIFESGLELARQLQGSQQYSEEESRPVISDLLRALGVLAARRGDYALAEVYYQEGLLLARHLGQSDTLGSLLRGLGVEAFTRGDYTRAEVLYEEGLALVQASGPRERESALLWALGMLAEDQGNLEEAESYLQQSVTLARELGQRERLTLVLRDLGIIAHERGDNAAAQRYLAEGLEVARELGHAWRANRILLELGELALYEGRLAEAETAFQQVLQLARQAGSQVMVALALFGQARLAAGRGNMPTARQAGLESLHIFQTIGHYKAGEVKEWLATIRPVPSHP